MPLLDEFALIRRLFAPAARHPGALDLADDAALLDCPPGRRLVLTTDAIVAGVHFLPDDPPELIARKLVRVNISDLAAMGAEPTALLLAACFPESVELAWMDRFAAGLRGDCETFGVALIGGDTVATPGPATFALTAVGMVESGRELRRSGARVGDQVWVSGTIGDAALGLFAARGAAAGLGKTTADYLIDRYRLPQPRVALGRALAGLAHAAMDISDGLVADLGHICAASGVGARISAANVPLSDAARDAIARGVGNGLVTAITGGDDYELLFTADEGAASLIGERAAALGLRATVIGSIIAGGGVRVDGPDGQEIQLPSAGYRHFGP